MPPLSLSPENNVLAAMVQWVEEGVAPTSFVAVHYNDNNVEDGVAFTRPLCQVCDNGTSATEFSPAP